MKAKRNYIIYGLMLAAFAALLLWIVHLGHAYDGLGPGAAPSGEDSPVGLLYDTLTINLKHPLSLLLLQVIAILITVRIFSYLFKYLGQPGVIGEIVAGIVLGPSVLGHLSPETFAFLFDPDSLVPLNIISQIGLVLFMFVIGMELDLGVIRRKASETLVISHASIIVPFLMGTALAWGADELGLIESTGFIENIFIGTILTATSVSITVETLKEMKKLETKVGNTILAAALIDDVLGLIALTLVCSLAGGDESIGTVLIKIVGFFIFAFVVGFGANRIFCWMLKRQHGWASHRNSVFAFVLCLVMAYCAEKFFGVADITGAYAAGLAVACTPKGTYIQTKYNPLGYLLLTPVFFASIGINVQITGLTGGMVVFSILLLLVSIISKLLGCGLGAKACQFTTRESIQVGVGMACRGEVALIVANRGLSMGVLSPAMMTPVVITVVCGTILTPILLKLSFRGHQETELVQNNIADRMAKHRQLDIITQQLLQQDEQMMKKN